MRKIVSAAILATLLSFGGASAQTPSGAACKYISYQAVLTAEQWNYCFQIKQDTLNFTPVNRAGDFMTGTLVTAASSAATAGFNLPHGTAPSAPVNGDVWTTTAGLFAQINGTTVGPFSGATSSGFAATSPLAVTFPAGVVTYGITGSAGAVLNGSPAAFTVTPTLGIPGTSMGSISFANLTSGTLTLRPAAGTLGSNFLIIPNTTDTLAGISLVNGGTGAGLVASNGGLVYSSTASLAILSGTATAGQIPLSGSNAAPSWSTATYPSTSAAGTVMASGSANTFAATATPTLGVAGSVVGSVAFANATSGTETIRPATGALGAGIATLVAGTYNIVGDSLTQTLTGKTIAGASNTLTVRLNADVTGQLPIANGGTGQATQTLGFNALAPTPVRAGDIIYFNGTNWVQLSGNNSGTQVLQETAAGVPSWATISGAGTVTSVTCGTGLTGGTFTTSGTCALSTPVSVANGGTGDTGTAWSSFASALTCGTATITTTSATSKTLGKTTFLQVDFTITAIGSCTNAITMTLPNTAQNGASMVGREIATTGIGSVTSILAGSATATITKASAAAFLVNEHYVMSGVYQNQ